MKMIEYFQVVHYQRHNQERQENLAALGLSLDGKIVLEVGAGIGDHNSFFLDRKCSVIKKRHLSVNALNWNIEEPIFLGSFSNQLLMVQNRC